MRQIMPFYQKLSYFFTKDRIIDTPHNYGTMGGQEDSPSGTSPKEKKVQGGPGMAEQLGAQELVTKGHKARAQLLELAPKEVGPFCC